MQRNCVTGLSHSFPCWAAPIEVFSGTKQGGRMALEENHDMKISLPIIGLAVLLTATAQAQTPFTIGNLVVGRVGDGTNALVNSGGNITVLEYTTAGSVVQSISVPSGSGGLQVSGTATSELALSRSADNQQLVIAGYVPPFSGSGSLAGRSAANAPRGFVTIGSNGTVSSTTTLTGSYSGDNIRSGVTSGSNAWFTGSPGSGSGLVYSNGSTQTQIQDVNSRVVDIHSGNLYFSTGAGTQGIYAFSGLPTSATTATAVIAGVSGQGTDPYDFAFNDLNTIAYIADAAVGVQKFTWSGSAWVHAYNITTAATGLTGLAVDFTGGNPVIYALNPTNLYSFTDTGSAGAMTSIATAGSNYAFRGLDFAPVPEPTTWALIGLGLGFMVWNLRRKRTFKA